MSEATNVATAAIPRMNFSRRTMIGVNAPVLLQANLGAAGVLGVDALKSQRVDFDFARRRMSIMPSARRRERSSDPNTVVVVDALRSFSRFSVDFADRTVRFELWAAAAQRLVLSR
jgi:hypothetical protein